MEQWLADQPDASVFISAVTEGELRYGVALLPPGKRRSTLAAVIDDRAADSAFFSFAQAAAFVICRASGMGA